MRGKRKSCVAMAQGERKHAISKKNRPVSMKIKIEGSNIVDANSGEEREVGYSQS